MRSEPVTLFTTFSTAAAAAASVIRRILRSSFETPDDVIKFGDISASTHVRRCSAEFGLFPPIIRRPGINGMSVSLQGILTRRPFDINLSEPFVVNRLAAGHRRSVTVLSHRL
jgi:hypothetical protein